MESRARRARGAIRTLIELEAHRCRLKLISGPVVSSSRVGLTSNEISPSSPSSMDVLATGLVGTSLSLSSFLSLSFLGGNLP